MQRIAVIIAIVTATVILPVAAQAQTKDAFEYWDLNGNSDLTCTEASGKDEGLKLPAYRDNRDGTGLIYEWLQRQRSSDTDNDGKTKLPFGNLPRLLLAWVCTEAVRTQNRELALGKSPTSEFMRTSARKVPCKL